MKEEREIRIPEENDWRAQAEALYFTDHLRITEICRIVGVTRKYVSAHLQACEGYDREREWRKKQSAERRREYQREWDREHRTYGGAVTEETIRREHDLAALELSREIYH